MLTPILKDKCNTNARINSILGDIDNQIARLSYSLLNNIRYGFDGCINFRKFRDLSTYKEIIIYKLLGNNCLDDFQWVEILSKVNNIINKN